MNPSNLPPGVGVSDIPGNRPEELEWDTFFETVSDYCSKNGIEPEAAFRIWRMGAQIYEGVEVRQTNNQCPGVLADGRECKSMYRRGDYCNRCGTLAPVVEIAPKNFNEGKESTMPGRKKAKGY